MLENCNRNFGKFSEVRYFPPKLRWRNKRTRNSVVSLWFVLCKKRTRKSSVFDKTRQPKKKNHWRQRNAPENRALFFFSPGVRFLLPIKMSEQRETRLKRKASSGVQEVLASSKPKRSKPTPSGPKPLVTKYEDEIRKHYKAGCSYEEITDALKKEHGAEAKGLTASQVKGKVARMLKKGTLQAAPVGKSAPSLPAGKKSCRYLCLC